MSKKIFKFTGKLIYTESNAGTASSLGITPLNFDARCISLSDQYMEFRFTKLKFHVYQGGSGFVTIGYSPSVASTAPNTAQQVLDCQNSSTGPNGGVIGWPVPKLVLRRQDLTNNGPKWFRRGTAYDDLLEQQGVFYIHTSLGSFSTQNATITVEWELECAAPLAAADTVSVSRVDPRLAAKLAALRSEMKKRDEEEIRKIDAKDSPPNKLIVDTGEDPVLEKIRDLLLRDGMVIVGNPPS